MSKEQRIHFPDLCDIEFKTRTNTGNPGDSDLYISKTEGKLFACLSDDEIDERTEIGSIEMTHVELSCIMDDHADGFGVLDEYGQGELLEYHAALIDSDDCSFKEDIGAGFTANLLIVDAIIIKSEFRGEGYGYYLLDRAIRLYGHNSVVALEVVPLQFSDRAEHDKDDIAAELLCKDKKQAKDNLIRYYEAFGFQYSGYKNIYYLDTEIMRPQPHKLLNNSRKAA